MADGFGIEGDAMRLANLIGDAITDLVSGFAMAEAAREKRDANCDDVMAQLSVLENPWLVDMVLEKIRAGQ